MKRITTETRGPGASSPSPNDGDLALPDLAAVVAKHVRRQRKRKLVPYHDRVLVRRVAASDGFMVTPSAAREAPIECQVIAVGPGKTMQDGSIRPVCCKEGDHVILAKYGGSDFEFDGDGYSVVREDEIALGIVEVQEPETQEEQDDVPDPEPDRQDVDDVEDVEEP